MADGEGAERAGPGRDLSALLAGAAAGTAACGALLALTDSGSPLRGPCALFFLLAAPALAIAVALRGLDPFGRLIAALAGAVALDMLVAQAMLTVHRWSVTGGIVAVTVLSLLILLATRARQGEGSREGTPEGSKTGQSSVTAKPTDS
ncbi:hypothetical protein [Streptomyces sp. SID1328]|uniref:hypothetical protein n=1 Tax=Streptomyces sp. SID1328 TaxID=2690250 RepID=UPI001F173269|nr:hypothetical protein [Streptomyces sp. SID1328]